MTSWYFVAGSFSALAFIGNPSVRTTLHLVSGILFLPALLACVAAAPPCGESRRSGALAGTLPPPVRSEPSVLCLTNRLFQTSLLRGEFFAPLGEGHVAASHLLLVLVRFRLRNARTPASEACAREQ
jgi:hypothetical protein